MKKLLMLLFVVALTTTGYSQVRVYNYTDAAIMVKIFYNDDGVGCTPDCIEGSCVPVLDSNGILFDDCSGIPVMAQAYLSCVLPIEATCTRQFNTEAGTCTETFGTSFTIVWSYAYGEYRVDIYD